MFSIIKNGFTLVELIVTAAVLAIIAAIALPAFQHYMAEQEVQSTVAKLIMANRSARNLALLHHANVVICPSEGLAQCEPAKWSRGFIVFADLNKNRQADAGEGAGFHHGHRMEERRHRRGGHRRSGQPCVQGRHSRVKNKPGHDQVGVQLRVAHTDGAKAQVARGAVAQHKARQQQQAASNTLAAVRNLPVTVAQLD